MDEDSEKYNMNQCVMEDIVVIEAIDRKGKQYIDNYQVNLYASLDFATNTNFGERLLQHPNFTSNSIQSEDARNAARSARIKVISILKQDGCFDIDKFK